MGVDGGKERWVGVGGKEGGGMEGGICGGSFFHTRSGGEILRKEYPLARMNVGLER